MKWRTMEILAQAPMTCVPDQLADEIRLAAEFFMDNPHGDQIVFGEVGKGWIATPVTTLEFGRRFADSVAVQEACKADKRTLLKYRA